jgi:hypothetical protein
MADLTALIVGGGLLAAFWTGTNAVFTGAKQTNETRDRIVLGKIGNDELPEGHAIRMLQYDWLPMKAGLAAVSLMLGIIIWQLPSLATQPSSPQSFWLICDMAAIVPFSGFVTFLISGIVEFRFMREVIRKRGMSAGEE